jgi:hypothetical protein
MLFTLFLISLQDREQLHVWPLTRAFARAALYVNEIYVALLHKLRCAAFGTIQHVTG